MTRPVRVQARDRQAIINGREILYAAMTEAAWMRQIMTWGRRGGWLVYHVHDSRTQEWGTDAGFPDLVLLKAPALLLIEVKRSGGRVSPRQKVWLAGLSEVATVSADVWQPEDEDRVREILLGGCQ